MQVEIIGTSGAFAPGTNVSMIIWPQDTKQNGILLDCGFSVFQKLQELDFSSKLDVVLLSHLHQDHCGSAVTLAEFCDQINHHKLRTGGIDWQELLTLSDADEGKIRTLPLAANFPLQTFSVPHVKGMKSLALFYDNKILYSGDTSVSLLDTPQAAIAKLIIHDAALKANAFHCGLKSLADAPKEIKAKTWVTHYHPKDLEAYKTLCQEYGLAGVLEAGMSFQL